MNDRWVDQHCIVELVINGERRSLSTRVRPGATDEEKLHIIRHSVNQIVLDAARYLEPVVRFENVDMRRMAAGPAPIRPWDLDSPSAPAPAPAPPGVMNMGARGRR